MGQTIAYAASRGVPLASLAVPFSGLLALAGGLSILLGYRARMGAWLIVLSQEARRVAQEESWRQTKLLLSEIEAHKRTDAKLQEAKEPAAGVSGRRGRVQLRPWRGKGCRRLSRFGWR